MDGFHGWVFHGEETSGTPGKSRWTRSPGAGGCWARKPAMAAGCFTKPWYLPWLYHLGEKKHDNTRSPLGDGDIGDESQKYSEIHESSWICLASFPSLEMIPFSPVAAKFIKVLLACVPCNQPPRHFPLWLRSTLFWILLFATTSPGCSSVFDTMNKKSFGERYPSSWISVKHPEALQMELFSNWLANFGRCRASGHHSSIQDGFEPDRDAVDSWSGNNIPNTSQPGNQAARSLARTEQLVENEFLSWCWLYYPNLT